MTRLSANNELESLKWARTLSLKTRGVIEVGRLLFPI